ncbi:MAG: VCBS repeat-containing protein [Verrucomicrobiae bacterium]|nr:VCBS repeat-containing protein [Verrucomicrobiae bacterium]
MTAARFSDRLNRVGFPVLPSLVTFLAVTDFLVAAPSAKFVPEVVDGSIEIGYGLAIGDVNGDGRPDILLADKRRFCWYENPGWERHLIFQNLTLRDNVCLAAADIDGDGRVEVAVGAQWNPGETTDATQSGSVHFLIRPADPTQVWTPVPLFHDPTVHRMRWIRTGEGDWRLVVLPLHGIGNEKGKGPNGVNIRAYLPPAPERWGDPEAWSQVVIDDSMHATHNFDDREGDILVAGAEGILRKSVMNTDPDEDALLITPENSLPPTRGAGEVRFARGFIAAIEPMHGNELVVYEEGSGDDGAKWRRTTLTNELNQGHALATGDLLGMGNDQVIAGWRNPNAEGQVGIRLFWRDPENDAVWHSMTIDENTMACEDLKLADLDGDGRLDIVAAGRSTGNLLIYWNRGMETVAD